MFIAAVVVAVALALLLLVSARGKLVRDPAQMQTLGKVGFPVERVPLLAAAELAGAIGMLAGLAWWPVGVAAAAGVVAYFTGATVSHLRVRDGNVTAPVVIGAIAGAELVLRIGSR